MTGLAVYSGWVRRDYASKSQQVVLAAGVFDDKGRIMVSQDGYLPSEVVTDTYFPKVRRTVPLLNALLDLLFNLLLLTQSSPMTISLATDTRYFTGCSARLEIGELFQLLRPRWQTTFLP